MRNQIQYEWCFETVDEGGDIIDNYFEDKLKDFRSDAEGDLCLVMNEGNESQGLENRYWAYVKDGQLDKFFQDGTGGQLKDLPVPKRFQKELALYLKNK